MNNTEGGATIKKVRKQRKAKSTEGKTKTKRKSNLPDQPLNAKGQELMGKKEAKRSEVVKKVWEHIKKQNLQVPENKRDIKFDKKLENIKDKN